MKQLGSVNQFVQMRARSARTGDFLIDGTTLDLVRRAVAKGAKVGDVIESELGKHTLKSAPHDDRAGGFWVDRIW
jgi:hypothetical protein